MFCPHCGKQTHETAQYCENCGREIVLPKTEQTAHAPDSLNVFPVQYAGFWRRVLAAIIDTIIIQIAAAPFTWHAEFDLFSMTFGLELVIQWLYCALFESSFRQATIGKIVMNIVVTDLNYRRISFARATGRHFAKYISAIILGIGYIMVAFTEKKQGLHDILADTLVVQK
ncbi:MAG: RDD family protein [bacterium]|nr:RDD family protein [bacterium]